MSGRREGMLEALSIIERRLKEEQTKGTGLSAAMALALHEVARDAADIPAAESAAPELADALEGLLEAEGYSGPPRARVANCCHCSKLRAHEPHEATCPVAVALSALAKTGRVLAVLACLALLTLANACASAPLRDPCSEPCSEDCGPCVLYQGQCTPAEEEGRGWAF